MPLKKSSKTTNKHFFGLVNTALNLSDSVKIKILDKKMLQKVLKRPLKNWSLIRALLSVFYSDCYLDPYTYTLDGGLTLLLFSRETLSQVRPYTF